MQYPWLTGQYQDSSSGRRPLWPQKLVIVSHDFKRSRFLDLHVPAIKAPLEIIEFIGIDPPFDHEQLRQVVEGDRLRGYGAWEQDPKGNGRLLSDKRALRGWDIELFQRDVLDPAPYDDDLKKTLRAIVEARDNVAWPM
jgi:hypothetical protein